MKTGSFLLNPPHARLPAGYTRAFLSIPARHDVARRVDCAYLARLTAEEQLDEDEAFELARELAIELARRAYKL